MAEKFELDALRNAVQLELQRLQHGLEKAESKLAVDIEFAEQRRQSEQAIEREKLERLIESNKQEATSLERNTRFLIGAIGALIAIAGFVGAPSYYAFKIESATKDAKEEFDKLSKELTAKNEEFRSILDGIKLGGRVVFAANYDEKDPYVLAVKGRMAASINNTASPIWLQLPDPSAIEGGGMIAEAMAAEKLNFAVRWFPEGTVCAVVYNPSAKPQKLFVSKLKNGKYFVGTRNYFSDEFIRLQGGACDSAWLGRVPGDLKIQDLSLGGIALIAPTAVWLAAPGKKERDIGELGNRFDLQSINKPELPSGLLGWVLYVDAFGNCMTSIPSTSLPLGTSFKLRIGNDSVELRKRSSFAEAEKLEQFAIDFEGFTNLVKKDGSFADEHLIQEGNQIRSEEKATGGK